MSKARITLCRAWFIQLSDYETIGQISGQNIRS